MLSQNKTTINGTERKFSLYEPEDSEHYDAAEQFPWDTVVFLIICTLSAAAIGYFIGKGS